MFEVEAARLCEILLERGGEVSPLLNLGSSTLDFRRTAKPHIEARLFAPLREAGIEVVHCDLKAGEGVDVAGDIYDLGLRARLAAMGFRCVLAANLLEHVRDRAAVAAACEEIVGPGGLILATVPSSAPYHADPIDTLYRPSSASLAASFLRSRPLLAEEVAGPTYAERIAAEGSSLWREIARTAGFGLIAFARPKSARARWSRWRWYRRPQRVAIALLRVNAS
jgi:SAM-dependent methyltransferase